MACRPNAFSAVSARSASPLFLNTCDGGQNDFCPGGDNESNEGDDACSEKQVALNMVDARLVADAPMAVPAHTDEIPGVPLDEGIEFLSPQLMNTILGNGTCVLIDVRGGDRAAG